jgi:hypothetical protein
MNIINLKSAFVLVLISNLLFSCRPEIAEEKKCTISMQNLSGKYKLVSLTYKENSTAAEMDFRSFQEPCEQDDFLILNQNGTYTTEDAGVSCNANENGLGSWSLTGNELESDGILAGTITNFDCKTLEYSVKNTYKDGDIFNFKLVKQ